jgi:hypothetical protein
MVVAQQGEMKMDYKIHTLANGATVVTTSPHPFKFSDGTVSEAQSKELCDFFTLKKTFGVVREIKGMKITETRFIVSNEQYDFLFELSKKVDIILVPFPFLQSLKEELLSDERDCIHFLPNVVAFNSTPETSRSAPQDKIVDINNWSGF